MITPYVPPTSLSSLPSGIWSGAAGLPVFPYLTGQNPTVTKGPLWSGKRIRTTSGRQFTTNFWPFPLWQFELSYEFIRHKPTVPELFTMWEFFNTAQGQFATWLFVDPSDNQVLSSAPASFGTGDGTTKTFQLSRQINSWSEPVYDVYSPTILNNGTPTAAYTQTPNGQITFTTAPAAGHALTWYGYFYFGCNFDQDDLTFAQIVNLLWSGKSVKFSSQRA